MPTLTLDLLNSLPAEDAAARLDGLYEHSPWIAEAALRERPFRGLAQFQHALARAVTQAPREAQLALIRAHPELAGKAMVARTLTAESTNEQGKAGLTACTPEEFDRIQQLNADYNSRFGFPFILAVRGPRGNGLGKQAIIETFARRLRNLPDFEFDEALRNIHRIAEIRLQDKFGIEPALGQAAWDGMETLARYTDAGYEALGQLTVTYLTEAHQACARHLAELMRETGFDEVHIDAVGNGGTLPQRGRRGQDAADRIALRHGTQRRQVRRPPGHLRAAGVGSRAEETRAPSALPHRACLLYTSDAADE